MTIVMVMNLPYHPAHGGANKSNRIVAELLAERGHVVHVIAPALDVPERLSLAQVRAQLMGLGAEVAPHADVDRVRLHGVDLHAVTNRDRLRDELMRSIASLDPDWVMVSSEEPSQYLLQTAVTHAPGRVAYLLLTPSFLPFGPLAFYPGPKRAAVFAQVSCLIATSQFSADYVHRWSPYTASVCHLPVYGSGPHADFGAAAQGGYVTLVNACTYKGLEILLGLAASLPQVAFAAIRGWGTTSADLTRLQAQPNITVLPPRDDIDDILRQTRVLLMPSLWLENFPLTVIETMLRGIPVLAADVGGLREATLGTRSPLPVSPIERFTDSLDENHLPIAIVSPQDIRPWRQALLPLLEDPDHYARESRAARAAATAFHQRLHIGTLETLLAGTRVKEHSL